MITANRISRFLPCRFVTGFTVIEIIVTLLLIAILGAMFMARLGSANAFNGVVIRDQIISLTRLAQQNAFGREDLELIFQPDGSGEATITVSSGAEQLEQVSVPVTSVSLTGDRDVANSCTVTPGGNTISAGNPLRLHFGTLGQLVASSGVGTDVGVVNRSVRVCVNNDSDLSVCISPSGYAYTGDCDV